MPENLEPAHPPRRRRHIFRWVLGLLLVLLFAGSAVIYRLWTMPNPPDNVKLGKLRGKVLADQIRYGGDKSETRNARLSLVYALMEQKSYAVAELEWRALVVWSERVQGTNVYDTRTFRLMLSHCLFLEGQEEEARRLLRGVMESEKHEPGRDFVGLAPLYNIPFASSDERFPRELRFSKFVAEQINEAFQYDAVTRLIQVQEYSNPRQRISNGPAGSYDILEPPRAP